MRTNPTLPPIPGDFHSRPSTCSNSTVESSFSSTTTLPPIPVSTHKIDTDDKHARTLTRTDRNDTSGYQSSTKTHPLPNTDRIKNFHLIALKKIEMMQRKIAGLGPKRRKKQSSRPCTNKPEWNIRQPQHASANSSSGCFFNINEEQELREQAKRLNQIAKNRIIWTPKVKAKPKEPNVFGISKEALHTKGKGSTSPAMEKREERYKLYC